jgi:hypothetical protein
MPPAKRDCRRPAGYDSRPPLNIKVFYVTPRHQFFYAVLLSPPAPLGVQTVCAPKAPPRVRPRSVGLAPRSGSFYAPPPFIPPRGGHPAFVAAPSSFVRAGQVAPQGGAYACSYPPANTLLRFSFQVPDPPVAGGVICTLSVPSPPAPRGGWVAGEDRAGFAVDCLPYRHKCRCETHAKKTRNHPESKPANFVGEGGRIFLTIPRECINRAH